MTIDLSDKIISALKNFYGPVKPGLDYANIYQLTISVVLSAQTTDKQVNKVTPELFDKYPDYEYLSKANIADVQNIIHSTGFYKTKSENIINLSRIVTERFNGETPSLMSELTELPGVGRKSANVIISQGFGKPGFAVDTHVKRISNRLGYSKSQNPLIIEKDCLKFIPPQKTLDAHLLFIHHGREICASRNPKCNNCPINSLCITYTEDFSN